ncbi:MAG: D-alanine--D-alanine ligase family protein, partial [Planctomycetota bacterium]
LAPEVVDSIQRVCRRVYHILQIRDYGRIDLRLTPDNRVVILEANANPDIAYGEEVAEAAEKASLPYEKLIDRILRLALRRYE